MFIATLIAADRLGPPAISEAVARLASIGANPELPRTIDEGSSTDIPFAGDPVPARLALEATLHGLDVVVQPAGGREKKLLVADMDSTMITVECIDELADYAGIKAEVAAVTERAMRGEIDFETALDARVRLLTGLHEAVLNRCYEERVRLTPGAKALVGTMRARGARTALVSGGFTVFAERVADSLGFHWSLANRLGISDGNLDGTVARPIVTADTKRAELLAECRRMKLPVAATLAVGDGANDIPMIKAAGLGIAYHAKARTAAAADARIDHGDLTALLWAQGIPRRDWVN